MKSRRSRSIAPILSHLTMLIVVAVFFSQGDTALSQNSPGVARMLNTKHNLSVSGPGPIRAEKENQLCVFCHTPHVPAGYSADQLWNHQATSANYILYSSDYLTDLNYAAPNQPNQRSKLCLSCHDGTIALGAVYNNGGGPTTIAMQNNVVNMPAGAAGDLGTSLVNDHPVGYVYDNGRDPELVGRQWPWNTPVKLDPDLAAGTIECQTCHDPHDNTNTKFLRISNTNAALCTFCHNKTGWSTAAHKVSLQAYTPPGAAGTTVGEWACRDCHQSHNGAGVPYLLTGVEEATCYNAGCHGSVSTGSDTKNIQSEFDKIVSHPTHTVTGKHRNPDNSTTLNVPNRHAECADCHNSHQAKSGLHTFQSNIISLSLAGVRGVVPDPTPAWTQPASYTPINPAQQENQICLKCHSSYAFGNVANGVTSITGPSGDYVTDQAMEFNPANQSAHPVMASSNAQTGSTAPKSLDPSQMTVQWNDVLNQTMYCSDCHGNDQPTSATTPQGPHGSTAKYMLTGNAKYWPLNPSNQPWSLNDIKTNVNWQNDLFCANCHPMYSNGLFLNNVHTAAEHQTPDVKCVTCHVAIPHGAPHARLIGYASDPSPYNFNGASLVIASFQKAAGPTLYTSANCSMNGVCHQGPKAKFNRFHK
jgi:predicted CXXCH cytochrome family protein